MSVSRPRGANKATSGGRMMCRNEGHKFTPLGVMSTADIKADGAFTLQPRGRHLARATLSLRQRSSPPSFNYNTATEPVAFLKGPEGWPVAWVRRKDRKPGGRYLFLLLLKTSITCFRVCVTHAVPSCDPINLVAELLSALSGTLISACDEGEGGQLIYLFFSSRR